MRHAAYTDKQPKLYRAEASRGAVLRSEFLPEEVKQPEIQATELNLVRPYLALPRNCSR